MEKKLAKNFTLLVGASLFANLFLFLFNIAMARGLAPEEFGVLAIVTSITTFFVILFELGISTSTTHLLSGALGKKDEKAARDVLSSSTKLFAVVSVLPTLMLFILSDAISLFLQNSTIGPLLKIASVSVFSAMVIKYCISIFYAFQEMFFPGIVSAMQSFLRLLFSTGFVLAGFGLFGAVFGFSTASLAGAVISVILLLFFLKKNNLPALSHSTKKTEILKYGIYSAPQFWGLYLIPIISNIVVAAMASSIDVAYFTLAFSTTSIVFIVLLPISNALLPFTSEMHSSPEKKKKIARLGEGLLMKSWIGTAIIISVIIFFSKEITWALYGTGYEEAAMLLSILGFAVLFDSQKVITDPMLTGTGNAKSASLIEIAKILLVVIAGYYTTKSLGTVGLAGVIFVAYLSSFVAKILVCRSRLSISLWKAKMHYFFFLCLVIAASLLFSFNPIFFFSAFAIIIFAATKRKPA